VRAAPPAGSPSTEPGPDALPVGGRPPRPVAGTTLPAEATGRRRRHRIVTAGPGGQRGPHPAGTAGPPTPRYRPRGERSPAAGPGSCGLRPTGRTRNRRSGIAAVLPRGSPSSGPRSRRDSAHGRRPPSRPGPPRPAPGVARYRR